MAHAKPRLFRDPVHDIIALEPDKPSGRLLLALLDTPEMQRLRRIRQLALSHLVYHGAEHSRFAHSMGVAHLTGRMLAQVMRSVDVSEEQQLITLAAALLHDVGHGPFSHTLESVTHIRHEHYTQAVIRNPQGGIYPVLHAVDPSFPERVAARACGDPNDTPACLRELVSSQLDADRMDYILRDALMTGVKIGSFDLARIIAMLDITEDGHLALHAGAQEAVEGYLLARFHMYKQVYLHKTSRTAERMLETALRRAGALAQEGNPPRYWPDGPLSQMLKGEPLCPSDYTTLDDTDIWAALKAWARGSGDELLDGLARGLVQRQLYKTLPLPPDSTQRAKELIESARAIARVKGFDPDVHVLVDETLDSPYRPFTGLENASKSIRLLVSGEHGTLKTAFLEDRSEFVELMGRLYHQRRYLCFHPDLTEAMKRLTRR